MNSEFCPIFFSVQDLNYVFPDFQPVYTVMQGKFLTLQIRPSIVLDCQEVPQVHPGCKSCYDFRSI